MPIDSNMIIEFKWSNLNYMDMIFLDHVGYILWLHQKNLCVLFYSEDFKEKESEHKDGLAPGLA